jgi:hypothetical protein
VGEGWKPKTKVTPRRGRIRARAPTFGLTQRSRVAALGGEELRGTDGHAGDGEEILAGRHPGEEDRYRQPEREGVYDEQEEHPDVPSGRVAIAAPTDLVLPPV